MLSLPSNLTFYRKAVSTLQLQEAKKMASTCQRSWIKAGGI